MSSPNYASVDNCVHEFNSFIEDLFDENNNTDDVPDLTVQETDSTLNKPVVEPIVTSLVEVPENYKVATEVNLDFGAPTVSHVDFEYIINVPLTQTESCNHNNSHGVESNLKITATHKINKPSGFELDSSFDFDFSDDELQKFLDESSERAHDVPTSVSSSNNTLIVPHLQTIIGGKRATSKHERVRKSRNKRGQDSNKKVKLYVNSQIETRIHYCLNQIKQNNVYNNSVKILEYSASNVDGSYIIDRNLFERLLMLFLLPNNLTIENFKSLQNVEGWTYFPNKNQQLKRLPLRMCGQRANFYEPFVKREKKIAGKSQREGLCPYCQVNFNNLDGCFQDLTGSNYQHHVAKNHGVWNAGYEMPPPVIYKKNNQYSAMCSLCSDHPTLGKTNFTDLNDKNCLESELIGYYRHHFSKHSIPKKGAPEHEKKRNKEWFITEDPHMDLMYYEPS